MYRHSSLTVLLCAMLAVHPNSSRAETSLQAAHAWGLTGTWQMKCGSASKDNPVHRYRADGGRIVLDRDFGDGAEDTTVLASIQRSKDGKISYYITFATADGAETRYVEYVKFADLQIHRPFTTRIVNTGEYIVREGRFVANGTETKWFHRCN